MTTSVLVVNLGPLPVDVTTMSVSPAVVDGLGNSIRNAATAKVDRLAPNASKTFCLYDSQEIRASEVR